MAEIGDAGALREVFLHGTLQVSVLGARDVEGPRPSRFSFKRIERACTSSADGVDPYVSVKLGYNKVMQTNVVQNNASPEWNESATFRVAHDVDAIEFRVKAAKRTGLLAAVSKVKHLRAHRKARRRRLVPAQHLHRGAHCGGR
jgi:hypothetical protein